MNITFIGLGIMGEKMALNLINSGHRLTVHNRTKPKADELINRGALWADTARDGVKDADVVFTMLSTPCVVEDVAFGKNGFLDNMKEGSVWADCTTVNPSFTAYCMERIKLRNTSDFVDAPVAGSKIPATEASLTFLVGANKSLFERISPLLKFMGKRIVHCGPAGKGTEMKIVVNSLLGISMLGCIEAMALGESLGFDREFLMDTLLNTPVVAPIVKAKREKILNFDYEEEFPLKWMLKDLHFACELGYEKTAFMPLINIVKEIFNKAKISGLGDRDLIAAGEVYKK